MRNVWRISWLVALTVGALFALSCGEDYPVDCTSCACNPRLCPQQFQDLTQKGHVLNNFELAHNKRNMSQYERLIDDNYTFSFDTMKNGALTTIQWGRAEEITTTAGLLSAANMVSLDLADVDKATWTEMTAADNSGETWYITTVYYNFTIRIGPTTYMPVADAQMSFTVRNAGTTAKPHWTLVELRDDAHLNAPPPGTAARVALHTEQTTYGKMKSGM